MNGDLLAGAGHGDDIPSGDPAPGANLRACIHFPGAEGTMRRN
jgi:hypothetical protein